MAILNRLIVLKDSFTQMGSCKWGQPHEITGNTFFYHYTRSVTSYLLNSDEFEQRLIISRMFWHLSSNQRESREETRKSSSIINSHDQRLCHNFCIYLASQNDRLNLSFVKDEHIVGKKMTRNGRKWQLVWAVTTRRYLLISSFDTLWLKHFYT